MTKCNYCGGDMVWFGSIVTGFLGCPICCDDAPVVEADPLAIGHKIHEQLAEDVRRFLAPVSDEEEIP